MSSGQREEQWLAGISNRDFMFNLTDNPLMSSNNLGRYYAMDADTEPECSESSEPERGRARQRARQVSRASQGNSAPAADPTGAPATATAATEAHSSVLASKTTSTSKPMIGGLPRPVDPSKQKGGFQRAENARKRTANSTGSMEAERPSMKKGRESEDVSAPAMKSNPDIQIAPETITNRTQVFCSPELQMSYTINYRSPSEDDCISLWQHLKDLKSTVTDALDADVYQSPFTKEELQEIDLEAATSFMPILVNQSCGLRSRGMKGANACVKNIQLRKLLKRLSEHSLKQLERIPATNEAAQRRITPTNLVGEMMKTDESRIPASDYNDMIEAYAQLQIRVTERFRIELCQMQAKVERKLKSVMEVRNQVLSLVQFIDKRGHIANIPLPVMKLLRPHDHPCQCAECNPVLEDQLNQKLADREVLWKQEVRESIKDECAEVVIQDYHQKKFQEDTAWASHQPGCSIYPESSIYPWATQEVLDYQVRKQALTLTDRYESSEFYNYTEAQEAIEAQHHQDILDSNAYAEFCMPEKVDQRQREIEEDWLQEQGTTAEAYQVDDGYVGPETAEWQDQLDRRDRGEVAGPATKAVKEYRRWLAQLTEDENDKRDERLAELQQTIATRQYRIHRLSEDIKLATQEQFLSSRIEGILKSNIEIPRIFIMLSDDDFASIKPSGLTPEMTATIDKDREEDVRIRNKADTKARLIRFPNAWERFKSHHCCAEEEELRRLEQAAALEIRYHEQLAMQAPAEILDGIDQELVALYPRAPGSTECIEI